MGRQVAADKQLKNRIRIVFVGRIEEAKGVGRIIKIAQRLVETGLDVKVDLIGDGPKRYMFEDLANRAGIAECIGFHGWMSRDKIDAHYEKAHFILFPSTSSEGWPKVLSEAMAFGVVPLASDVSSIPQYLSRFQTGRSIPADDIEGFVRTMKWYCDNGHEWKRESENSVRAASYFGYTYYLERVQELLELS